MLSVDSRSRGRSKSPGRQERSRSRDTRAPSPPKAKPPPKSKKYYDEYSESQGSSESSESDHRSSRRKKEKPRYEVAEPKGHRTRSPDEPSMALTRGVDPREYAQSRDPQYHDQRDGRHSSYAEPAHYEYGRPEHPSRHGSYTNDDHSRLPPNERPSYAPPGAYKYEYDHPEARERNHRPSVTGPGDPRGISLDTSGHFDLNYGHAQPPPGYHASQIPPQQYGHGPMSPNHDPGHYGYPPVTAQATDSRHHSSSMTSGRVDYHVPDKYKYAEPAQKFEYASRPDDRKPYVQTAHAQILEIKPGHKNKSHDPPSPGLSGRTHRLSVSSGASALALPGQPHGRRSSSGALPPGSPLLEAYHGTYQSISPMPSPHMHAHKHDSDLSDIEPLEPEDSSSSDADSRHHRHAKAPKSILKKRVQIYDPEPDALSLAAALNHHTPKTEPIVEVLPHLSDDHMMALRTEYKKHIKVGGKGINLAKHIKMKVTGNLGKIAYPTALGRWEGEAHWANFWYQSGTSRRELLIESLMGRSNAEIRAIKECFRDKRYNDSLEKCMEMELKKDKFRNAVLLVLEEKRMDEITPLSSKLIRQDVEELHRALTSKEGGETAMINIVVVRSDTHLREVLRAYEGNYRKNFAREMIQKSRNLVGETLAHILNGVLNRPVRDALLLHQALTEENSKDRTELLISRLVRFHWEPRHLERVKAEYKRKYGGRVEDDVKKGTKGEFGEFCEGLLEVGGEGGSGKGRR
ncbi:hypothetical protein MMC09_003008 [Bachmanniomyces sp. S44760]|nr:hypothetical protein [Bachmanniomyces sp. S44760]